MGISTSNFLGDEYDYEKKIGYLSSLDSVNLPSFSYKIRVGDVIFDMEIREILWKIWLFFLFQN